MMRVVLDFGALANDLAVRLNFVTLLCNGGN
jgi:hypothetical protein